MASPNQFAIQHPDGDFWAGPDRWVKSPGRAVLYSSESYAQQVIDTRDDLAGLDLEVVPVLDLMQALKDSLGV